MSFLFQRIIGASVAGRAITAFANFDLEKSPAPRGSTLAIGGLHGDEYATVALLEIFRDKWLEHLDSTAPAIVVPLANPDGGARGSRYNAHGVDLNRNCVWNWHAQSEEPPGPAPWSEPESRALRDFILKIEPAKIISLHWALAEIDADGAQSTGLAQRMWEALDEQSRQPYRLRVAEPGRGQRRLERTYDICPGSFGQWCGYGLQYADGSRPAMVTLELPYDPNAEMRPTPLPEHHLAELHDRWRADAPAYLAAVERGVYAMLHAACTWECCAGG